MLVYGEHFISRYGRKWQYGGKEPHLNMEPIDLLDETKAAYGSPYSLVVIRPT